MLQNQEFIQEFVDEARGHIEKVEAALLSKDALSGDKETINDLFRAVHSIKGTAGFFGLTNIVSLAHAMENVLGEIRNGKYALTDETAELLLSANDSLKDMVENVLTSEDNDVSDQVQCLNRLLEKKPDSGSAAVAAERVAVVNEKQKTFYLDGGVRDLLKDGIQHGHKIYEIKMRLNRDLLNQNEGPVKLFKKIDAVGMVLDTVTDYSEINSLDDVVDSLWTGKKDIYLGILVSTVLERDLFAEAISLPPDQIAVLQIENIAGSIAEPKETPAAPPVITEKSRETKREETGHPVSDGSNRGDAPKQSLKLDDSIRVHVSVLNELLDMAGEMVLGRNQLLRTLENYRKSIPGLAPILQNIDRLTTGVQEKIMQTRMQPVANVFNKFPRIIRDIAKNLAKEIDLVIEGEDVELDKSMIEALTDPLTHLVRNSADHAIEQSDIREQLGKPRRGKIILRAYHEGGYVNIDVIDDGRGIDVEKVRKKAFEKELVSRGDAETLSEQEILKFIFKPGFSTAEKVTDVSGRGVGMDVVKTNIEKLGGSIEIQTAKGAGTTIRLMLPLTLAIIQSLIVGVEGQRFALPQVNLKEIVRVKRGDASYRIENLHEAEVLRLRGRLLPLVRLADVLGIERTYLNKETGERMPDRRQFFTDQRVAGETGASAPEEIISRRDEDDPLVRVLVLKIGNRMFGLVVDAIIGGEETLVKPLPVYLKRCVCYSGVTILGDGKTAMILDPEGIVRLSDFKFRGDGEADSVADAAKEKDMAELQNLLLFNCSGNETLALDLSVVSRVEEIRAAAIQNVGGKEYIQFNGDSLRVIRPEDYLPVNRGHDKPEKYYVIIPKLVSYPLGILIERIQDTVSTRINLNTDDIVADGLVGSAIYDNRILLIVNIYELFEKADPLHYKPGGARTVENKRILLVEDTSFFQRIETQYLENAGYSVTLAGNGREALERLAAEPFDVVVSDIHMPVMDGLELIKKIRECHPVRDLPAVALTSVTDERAKKAIIDSGFDYYEWKLDRDSLLRTVTTAINQPRREKVV